MALVQLRAMLEGGLKAPIGETLGFDLVEVERGRVVFEGRPDRSVYNPLGAVHGGYAATLLDSASASRSFGTGRQRAPRTLDLVSYLRGLRKQWTVRATGNRSPGRVSSLSQRVARRRRTPVRNRYGDAAGVRCRAKRAGALHLKGLFRFHQSRN